MRLIIIGIFASLIVFPDASVGGFVIQTIEVMLLLGVLSTLAFGQPRLFKAISRDYFSFGLLLFTAVAVLLLSIGLSDIRDLNHPRFHSALPVVAYTFFYAVSSSKAMRRAAFNIMSSAMLVGLLLNFLVLARPDLPLWSSFMLVGKGASGAEMFGTGGAGQGGRISGLVLGDPIFTAAFCSICALTGLAIFSLSKARLSRIKGAALIVLGAIFLAYTQTRMLLIFSSLLVAYTIVLWFPMFRILRRWGSLALIMCLSPFIIEVILAIFSARGNIADETLRLEAWRNSLGIIGESAHSFFFGTGIHHFFDTTGIYHSHNLWLYTGVVYGVPMAMVFALLYLIKMREVLKTLKVRRHLIRTGCTTPDDDDIIIYSTMLVFMVLLLESFVENTFFYIPRVSVFLYALLGLSKAASENTWMGHSRGITRYPTSNKKETNTKIEGVPGDERPLRSAIECVADRVMLDTQL